MNRIVFTLFLIILAGCKSSPTKTATGPLTGISEFEVALFLSPINDQNQQLLYKEVIASFERIGKVHCSEENIYAIQNSKPVLLLSIGEDERKGSIRVFAETEILVNRCRIGSEIWKSDFDNSENLVVPEIEGDKLVFRKIEKATEEAIPRSMPAKIIEEFAKAYQKSNSGRPTFHIHSKLI